ncbi:MAG: HAMP domain-containing protein, partial [Asticcacaulis sp.]
MVTLNDRSALESTLQTALWQSLGLGALLLLVLGAVALWVGRQIALPLERLAGVMEALRLEAAVSVVPGLERKDEIGQMARAVEGFRLQGEDVRRLREETHRLEQ